MPLSLLSLDVFFILCLYCFAKQVSGCWRGMLSWSFVNLFHWRWTREDSRVGRGRKQDISSPCSPPQTLSLSLAISAPWIQLLLDRLLWLQILHSVGWLFSSLQPRGSREPLFFFFSCSVETTSLHLASKCSIVCVQAHSIVPNSLGPHGLQPVRFFCLWYFPERNIGVGCHVLLHGIFLTQR